MNVKHDVPPVEIGMFIDGRWISEGERYGIENPATEEIVAEVPRGGASFVARAIDAACRARKAWASKTAYERGTILKAVADRMREEVDAIATLMTLEEGKPLAESRSEVLASAAFFEWYAEEGKRVYGETIPSMAPGKRHFVIRRPVGVCAAIAPANFPVLLPVRKISAALGAGCTVVARPSSLTPLCLMKVFACLEAAGVPAGVANLVLGPAVECVDAFLGDPRVRKLSFTGSTAVGKEILRKSAGNLQRLSLELGGHAPFIVFPDIPVEEAARGAVSAKFRNNGQVCIAASRFYVHESRIDAFAEAAVAFAERLEVGDGLEPGVDVGPMIDARALRKAEGLVEDARSLGARVLTGGRRHPDHPRGHFYQPTVLRDVDPRMRILREEPFSPILPVIPYATEQEVLAAANDTRYGLAAYVLTRDLATAIRMAEGLEFGIIGIGDLTPATAPCPFGGMKESGFGREGSRHGLDEYLDMKYVSVNI